MIQRRDFDSYEAYVHAQGGKARGRGAELLASRPAQARAFSALLREAVRFLTPGPVLCLGARTGAEMDAFNGLGFKGSVGIDLHPLGKDVRRGDWHAMPEFSDGSFSVVYSNSFDHCLYLDKACAEIARLLRPGGSFYLMASDKGLKDDARAAEWKRTKKHNEAIYWSHADELRDEVVALGFRQKRSWRSGIWSHFLLQPKAAPMRVVCSRSCAEPRRAKEQEHPGICVCGGSLTDEALA